MESCRDGGADNKKITFIFQNEPFFTINRKPGISFQKSGKVREKSGNSILEEKWEPCVNSTTKVLLNIKVHFPFINGKCTLILRSCESRSS